MTDNLTPEEEEAFWAQYEREEAIRQEVIREQPGRVIDLNKVNAEVKRRLAG